MIAKRVLIVLAVLRIFSGFAQANEKYEVVKVWPEAPQGWHFHMTWAVTIDNAGNVYVGDTGNYRVKKFDSEGRLLTQWGTPGKGDGQFQHIASIKVDGSGTIYVMDRDPGKWEHCRIQKFTPYGRFIGTFERTAPEADKFELPVDVAVGPRGNLFVLAVDYALEKRPPRPVRVEKYSPQGDFLTQWGSAGSGDGQFAHPQAIAVDTQGNVYVADEWNHRIQKFSSEGKFLMKWGGLGQSDGLFNKPRSIAFDKLGEVYVVDRHSVQKFTPAGKFLAKWNVKGEGQQPWQVAVHGSGHVYVTDIFSHKIIRFDPDGNVVSQWGSAGNGDGQFKTPGGIAVDASGSVFVADERNRRVQKFDSEGKFVSKWGSGYWCGLGAVCADASGNVYATDIGVHEVQKFNADGKLVARWGTEGSGDGQFHEPYGIAVGPSGKGHR
jgi:DNA-binding beta-propeller fold protein YncE